MARPGFVDTCAALPRLAAAVMLVLAAGNWSRDYYVLLRWLVFGAGGLVVVLAWKSHRYGWVWVMGMVSLLFNPLSEIHLSRAAWRIIDPGVALVFVISLFWVRVTSHERVESVG